MDIFTTAFAFFKGFKSLKTSLIFVFLVLTLTIISLVVGLQTYFSFINQKNVVLNQQRLIAKDAANTVGNFLDEKLRILNQAGDINNLVLNFDRRELTMGKMIGREPAFRQLFILDSLGSELARSSRVSSLTMNPLTQEIKQDILKNTLNRKNYISPVYIDSSTSEPLVVIATSVVDNSRQPIGSFVAEVNLKFMWDLVDSIKVGKTGHAYVIDKDGDLIAYGDTSRVLKRENFANLDKVKEFQGREDAPKPNFFEVVEGIKGNLVVSEFVPLGSPDWALVVEIPASEAYEPIINQFLVTFAIILVLVSLTVWAIFYFSALITLPIVNLTRVAKKISGGDFSEQARIESSDEVGVLAFSFNNMMNKLQSYQLGLEEKIGERTHELEESKRVLTTKVSELEDVKKAMFNLLEDGKKLEVDLRLARDQAEAIISSMGEGLLVIDTNYKIKLINKAAQQMLDLTDAEAISADWSKVIKVFHGENEAVLSYRSFYRAINEKKTFVTGVNDGHYYHTIKGKVFPVASVTSPLYSGNEVVGAIKVFRDVTNEKEEKTRIENIVDQRTKELREKNLALQKAQEQVTQGWMALQDEKARLTASINSLSLGFILTDNSDSILIMNPAAVAIFNNNTFTKYSEIETILKLGDANSLLKEKHLVELKEVNFENKILRIFMASITSNAKGQEEVIGKAIVVEDITEAKVLERSKDEFFSIASHELRTPLTSIRGNTSMILDYFLQEFKDPNLKEMIQDIHESSIRLIGIVNDFLDLSRLEQKRMEFKKESVDLIDLSKEVLSELKANTNGKVELKLLLPQYPKVHVLADKNKTKEIIINLVGNALKFTDSGSVSVRFEVKENMVETFIIDTGRGIPAANQNLLFRKFQQAGDSLFTRDTTKGTGLGLYISKLMVEGMGGVIRLVESTAGKGTTFSFTLPVAND